MSRITKFDAIKTIMGSKVYPDSTNTLATFERVNTQAPVYVDATYATMVRDGIGEKVADTARVLYGENIIDNDVYDNIKNQTYQLTHVFQLASAKTLEGKSADIEKHKDIFNDNNRRVATCVVDTNGEYVYLRCNNDGMTYKKRYTFMSFFKTFVEQAWKDVHYNNADSGTVTLKLTPVKSVQVIAHN